MVKLKPYAKYKKVDLPWLDKIPEHWGLRNLGRIMKPISARNRPELPLLSITREQGVIVRDIESNENHNYIPDDLSNYKVIEKGQFGMNKMKAWQGSYGISKYDGIVSPAYFVFDVEFENLDFFHRALRSPFYVNNFLKASDGVRIGQWDFDTAELKRMYIIAPPHPEQTQIAKYLDRKTEQIDRYIQLKERQIELLEEQKTAIINQAVTKGLDPNVPMKDSGIEWLGKIPEHWEMVALKYLYKSNRESLSENEDPNLRLNYIDISSVGFGFLKEKPQAFSFGAAPMRARRIVHKGDTIISTVRTYLKSIFYITEEHDNCIVSTGFSVLTPTEKINPSISRFLLSSEYFLGEVLKSSVGVSYPAISNGRLIQIKIPVPPKREQQETVNYLDTQISKIDTLIAQTKEKIKTMEELRTSLISSVVTGQLDVRKVSLD